MPKHPRLKSSTGIYHVIARGVSRQNIFYDKEDYRECLRLLESVKQRYGCLIYAYCLMSNHVHLLIKTQEDTLSEIMHRVCCLYGSWFNDKYERDGHLFQGRFHSEPIEEERYFMSVLSYIHFNPCKAGIAETMQSYPYSSYREYTKGVRGLADVKPVLRQMGLPGFIELHANVPDFVSDIEHIAKRKTESEARRLIAGRIKDGNPLAFCGLDLEIQSEYVSYFKSEGVTYAQIARITAMPYERIRYIGSRY